MTEAFRAWLGKQQNVARYYLGGRIRRHGNRDGRNADSADRRTEVMISTMAAGNVAAYVGPTDVTDDAFRHRRTKALTASRASTRPTARMPPRRWRATGSNKTHQIRASIPPLIVPFFVGMTMFGVTTPCVQQVIRLVEKIGSLFFHATGIGGRSMEKLIDSGLMRGVSMSRPPRSAT